MIIIGTPGPLRAPSANPKTLTSAEYKHLVSHPELVPSLPEHWQQEFARVQRWTRRSEAAKRAVQTKIAKYGKVPHRASKKVVDKAIEDRYAQIVELCSVFQPGGDFADTLSTGQLTTIDGIKWLIKVAKYQRPTAVYIAWLHDQVLGIFHSKDSAEDCCEAFRKNEGASYSWKELASGRWVTPNGPYSRLEVEEVVVQP